VPESDDVVAPFRVPRELVRPTTEFKSTWLTASLETLRARGHFERYLANLAAEHRAPILSSIAGVWLPMEICLAHYRACDALELSIAFRIAREAGVTPWTMLKTFPVEFDRQWRGGACGIFRIGPKDARVELIGFPVSVIPYARNGLRGMAAGLSELVCTKCYVHDIRELCTPTSIGYRVAWV